MSAWLSYNLPGEVESIFFEWDCTISESHSRPGSVTQWPVEEGSDISDHVQIDPVQLKMEGFVSNTPIGRTKGSYPVTGDGYTRGQQAHDAIVAIHGGKIPVDIFTDTVFYGPMIIETVNHDKTRGRSGGIWLNISLKEVNFVSAQDVRIKDSPAPIKVPPITELSTEEILANPYVVSRDERVRAGKAVLRQVDAIKRTDEKIAILDGTGTLGEKQFAIDAINAEDLARGN